MKKIISIVLILLAQQAFGQQLQALNASPIAPTITGPAGFWGVKFGESYENVFHYVRVRRFVAEIHTETVAANDKIMTIDNVSFGGNACKMVLQFYDNELINGVARVSVIHCDDVMDKYNEIKKSLVDKYGAPRSDNELYEPPYKKDDGYLGTGIRLGKIKVSSAWLFFKGTVLSTAIKLGISDDCVITVTYLDMIRGKQWQEGFTAKDMADY